MPVIGAFAVPHPPIIMPEIGRGEERKIAATDAAFREAARRCAQLKPDVIVVLSPHSVLYRDYFHISPGRRARGDFRAFGHPEVKVEADYDAELAAGIAAEAKKAGIAAGTMGERDAGLDHGTMIPLRYFFGQCGPVPVVRIGLSGFSLLEHYRFGEAIARAADSLGRRAVIIASGDLSHKLKADGPYGFVPEGPRFDERVMDVLARADFGAL
ncbi:MAG: AmmeMemoRadiSam system protein A, partial [Pyramidobacter sp.]|nr:AmmeMemoRadiSam system protein A [Pyramidobacter sp.]